MRVAVLGPGGVGGFVAGALERGGESVTVVAREPTAAILAERGLHVESVRLGHFDACPRAVTRLEGVVDVLVVAAKAPALEAALERIAESAAPALVVPLLNGLDHMAVLRARWGAVVVAGSIRIEADRPAPGRIVHTSPFLRVEMASADPAVAEPMRNFARALDTAGIPAFVLAREADVLWGKLVRLNALALTTSASGLLLGAIRSDPGWRSRLVGALDEGAAVGQAEGADVSAPRALAELEDAHESLGSSMQRDIEAGREPELDAIAGSVLRAASRHGISCPTIAELAAVVATRAGIPVPSS